MNRQESSRAQERREEAVARIQRQTRGPLASRRARSALAYGYIAAVALACSGALVARGLVSATLQLAAFVAMVALWFAMRRATRLVADAPEPALDELMVRLRNRAFVTAYQFLGVVCLAVAVVLFLSGPSGVSESLATALGWALFGAAFGLPLATTAIGIPDVDPEP